MRVEGISALSTSSWLVRIVNSVLSRLLLISLAHHDSKLNILYKDKIYEMYVLEFLCKLFIYIIIKEHDIIQKFK